MGEYSDDSNVSIITPPCKISTGDSKSPQNSDRKITGHHLCCLISVVIGAEPQRLYSNFPSLPIPFPKISVSTCCERYLLFGFEIFLYQIRPWQPPECAAYPSKQGERGAFVFARDVRMLEDL